MRDLEVVHRSLLEGAVYNWSPPSQPVDIATIPWLDRSKWNRARTFCLENFTQLLLSLMMSLTVGLSVNQLLLPLVFTGKSNTPEKSVRRYLSTLRHVLIWYLCDSTTVSQDLQQINNIHHKVSLEIRQSKEFDYHGRSFFSQYDYSAVQSGFFAIILLYPSQMGFRLTRDDMEAIVHLWHVIGYCLGIDNRSNICVPEDVSLVLDKCAALERCLVMPSLGRPPKNFDIMSQAFCQSINFILNARLCPLIQVNPVIRWALATSNSDWSHTEQLYPLGFSDWLRMWIYRLLMKTFYWTHWLTKRWLNPFISLRFCKQFGIPLDLKRDVRDSY